MSDTNSANQAHSAVSQPASGDAKPSGQTKDEGSFLWFLVKLVVVVLIFRTFVFSSFSIPSESMMPRLLVGDYLFAAKWPYGYSRASVPFDLPLIPGDALRGLPARGDVVIFKHPVDRTDYVKRVIGLPGETIQLVNGVVHIDGVPVKKEKVADFVQPISAEGGCFSVEFTVRQTDGSFACRYPRYRETLPNGVVHYTLDIGLTLQDTTQPVVVPEGRLFLMGDNRDNSLDSRFPAEAGRGVGLVPVENLVGRAGVMFFSTDGSAEWLKPWTWFTAARWNRIGKSI
ncbi:MAG: Signal peptidase [Pseudomonadota bacterium]